MSATADKKLRTLVVGLGETGYSVVRYLVAQGEDVTVTDSRAQPPALARLRALSAPVAVHCGDLDPQLVQHADRVVVSPGVARTGALFERARTRGVEVIGDIELFARAARAPVVGVTGTNGKSTVTTLLAQMAARAGIDVRAGGNLGTAALDLLDESAGLYVLELSSYQLETCPSLRLAAGAVLNVTPDHLDRYGDVARYAAAKARIFAQCDTAVVNLDDPLVAGMGNGARRRLGFSLCGAAGADYGLTADDLLARRGEPLLALADMKLAGRHNAANALAALALGEALQLPLSAMRAALRAFPGLAHRTQWVADAAGVRYVNDSKGTNVGATLAAVAGLPGPLLVIAGGDGKGQDFAPLRAAFADKVRVALLIGRDARAIGAALAGVCACEYCADLDAAVAAAAARAQPGDTVLLSPACASLDMFRDYTHRGQVFEQAVRRLAA